MADEPNKIIFSMLGVSKQYDRKYVLKDINLSYFYGAKIGVLGLNGSGKSTLLRILSGQDTKFEGEIVKQPGYTVGLLPQEPQLPPDATVRQCVEEGMAGTLALLKKFEDISAKFAEPMDDDEMNKLLEEQGDVQEKLDAADAWNIDHKLEMAMDAMRCPPDDAVIRTLSGGEKRRVAMTQLLLKNPDVLLLDEPTNHLDAESVAWLEQHLARYDGTVIAVTHDRYFLDNVAGWILELDRGSGIPWKGNYTGWLDQKQRRLAIEEKTETARQRALKRELEWAGQSPQARRAKSKARLKNYETMLAEQGKEKVQELEIYIPPGPRLGNVVIEASNVKKAFGDKLLMDGMTFSLPPGGIVGVIGPNGAGKTTLFRMIIGDETPDAGQVRVGDTVKLAYLDQSRASLEDDATVWQAISGGKDNVKLGNAEMNSRAYVSRFGFTGTDQQQALATLSGGQRNRVHLARMLTSGGNVILLDEPTNDLDVNTVRALEEALQNFAGCAVVVTHDRWFLDRIATHILAFEGESVIRFFDGNFSEYEADRRKRLGEEAERPHRISYRKLTK
ncbi:MAG: energy-dependent translational throttle protein EttA [Phycisphaerae bacterium]